MTKNQLGNNNHNNIDDNKNIENNLRISNIDIDRKLNNNITNNRREACRKGYNRRKNIDTLSKKRALVCLRFAG